MKKTLALLLSLVMTLGALLAFTSCETKAEKEARLAAEEEARLAAEAEAEKFASCYAVINFKNVGEVVLKLDYENAPITVKNFTSLAESGFYDGLTIIRIQEGFVIQGGENKNAVVPSIKGEFAENGVQNNITHTKGVISMARTTDPNSATSQFFICLDNVNCPLSLDGKYAGFGTTVKGMNVIDSLVERYARYGDPYNMGFIPYVEWQPVIESVKILWSEDAVAPYLA